MTTKKRITDYTDADFSDENEAKRYRYGTNPPLQIENGKPASLIVGHRKDREIFPFGTPLHHSKQNLGIEVSL